MNTLKHISFPSIGQLREVVANVNRQYNFVGLDENGEAIYDHTLPKPRLKFKSTVKIHGTNSGVCANNIDGMWMQSRENILSPTSDNAGFCQFCLAKKSVLLDIINKVATRENIDLNQNTISVYGEWAGASIQKGVGICNIEKSMFILGVKVSPFPIEGDETPPVAYWVDSSDLRSVEDRIYNILDYEQNEIEIDFNAPELVQNKLIELTLAVEDECPVAKAFGFEKTIGEGNVWVCTHNGNRYMFKSKGEKHSGKSKVRTLKPVDDAKINKAMEIAELVTPTWRLDQMLGEASNRINGGGIERSQLGPFIKLVMSDVVKEELPVISEAGLEIKEVSKYISEIARNYFFEQEKL